MEPIPGIKGLVVKSGRYYIVRKENGRLRRHRLTRVDQGEKALRAAYDRLPIVERPTTVQDLLRAYIRNGTKELSRITREKYRKQAEAAVPYVDSNGKEFLVGLMPFFGRMRIDAVTSVHVAQYLEQGKQLGRAVAANRERSMLSSAFEWGLRNGFAQFNPCRGVRRNRESPSREYVETDELIDTYRRAGAALQILLNAAYLSGLRQIDLINLRRSDLQEEGIVITESKTGHRRLVQWRPGMAEVIRRAIAHGDAIATKITKRLPHPRPLPEHVFVNQRGKPWTMWGVSSAMRRARADFAFRQLRAKAVTDGQDKNVVGHTGLMLKRYTRREVLEPLA